MPVGVGMATSAANIAVMPLIRSVLLLATENARSAASKSSATCRGVCAVTSAGTNTVMSEAKSVFTLISLLSWSKGNRCTSKTLILAERFRRLNAQPLQGWSNGRQRANHDHDQRDERQDDGAALHHGAFEHLLEPDRSQDTDECADAELPQGSREDTEQQAAAIGAERRPDADLTPAARDREGHQRVD